MRIALFASCALALVGCFMGIDSSLMDRDAALGDVRSDRDADTDAGGAGDGQPLEVGAPDGAPPPDVAMDPSLVGAWSFEETGATATDSSGHGHDGMFVGNVVRISGVVGQGIEMSGSGRMDVPTLEGAAFPATGTYSMWFGFNDGVVNGPSEWGLFDVHGAMQNRAHFALQQLPNGSSNIDINFVTASNQPAVTDYFSAVSGSWNHVVVVWDALRYDVYQGTKQGPLRRVSGATYDYPWNPSQQQFRLGTGFYGGIDEVRIYSRPFAAAEVGGIP
jgi:hypothetical protein